MKTWPKGLWREVPHGYYAVTVIAAGGAGLLLAVGPAASAGVLTVIAYLAYRCGMLEALARRLNREIDSLTLANMTQAAEVSRLRAALRENADTVSKANTIIGAGRHAGR